MSSLLSYLNPFSYGAKTEPSKPDSDKPVDDKTKTQDVPVGVGSTGSSLESADKSNAEETNQSKAGWSCVSSAKDWFFWACRPLFALYSKICSLCKKSS